MRHALHDQICGPACVGGPCSAVPARADDQLIPWTSLRLPGGSRDTKLARRRRLWAWRDGASEMAPTDAEGRALTPAEVSWEGCERAPGRPAEAGARSEAVLVRLLPAELSACQAAAGRAGRPLSTWVREAAVREAGSARVEEVCPVDGKIVTEAPR